MMFTNRIIIRNFSVTAKLRCSKKLKDLLESAATG